MILRSLSALLITVATLHGAAFAAPAIDLSALKATPCEGLDGYEWMLRGKFSLRCAALVTVEGPSGGTKNELAVAILEPLDHAAARLPPTVIIHGGPGIGIADGWWMFPGMAFAQDAPTILFDQRSVGLSKPKLCPELDQDDPKFDKALPEEHARLGLKYLKECLAKLAENGVNLAAIGTDATVRDMEALRTALKIEQWNIFGTSYGTSVGLAYLAQHPAHVRAAVLDSLYPPEMQGFSSVVPDFMESLAALNRLCAARPRCAARFGDIEVSLRNAIVALDRDPLPLEVATAGHAGTVRHLSGSALLTIVQSNLLFSGQWPQIPLLIADAGHRRPTARLARAFASMTAELPKMSTLVYLATECRERAPFEDRAALKQQAGRWPVFARATGVDALLAACDLWPVQGEKWETPRNTPVPTLVVAGEWDPATPAAQAQRAAAVLGPRATYTLLRGQAHGATWDEPCASTLVRDFLRNPANTPNAACAATLQAPPLATRIVELEADAAYNPDLLPASEPVFIAALLSAFVWPLAWLARRTRGVEVEATRFTKRSPFWLTLAALSTVLCAYPFVQIAYVNGSPAAWLSNGIPSEAWPTFLLLSLVVMATPLAGGAMISEALAKKLSVLQLLHRGLVLVSLIAALASFWRLGALAQLPAHLMDEIGQNVGLVTGINPLAPP
ncbi:MAG: alpha/beta fold hydrolase [Micropepsaceae bacterium]